MEKNNFTEQVHTLIEVFDNWADRAYERKINLKGKIRDLNIKKNSQNRLIRQYKFQNFVNNINLKIKGSNIVKLSKKYAINKTDKKIKPKEVETQNNNEYFGSICSINDEIEKIKKQISILENKLNIQEKDRQETIKKLKFYKRRLIIINNYLDLLFSRIKKLTISSRIIEDEIDKINKIK